MSAQQTIYERIKEDLKGDKILQNVILERLWYYLEPIKDIAGGGGAPTGPAGGDLGGAYPNPTVEGLQGNPLEAETPIAGDFLLFNGLQWFNTAFPTVVGDMLKADYDPANLNQQITVQSIYDDYATISGMSDANIIVGQGYVINDADTAISSAIKYVKVFGEWTLDGSGDPIKGFSESGWVYLKDAKIWMPCQFNMASKRIDINPITKKVSFTASEIRNGNTTPLVLVKGYDGLYAQIETMAAKFTYVAPDFDGAYDLNVTYASSGDPIFQAIGFWATVAADFGATICHVNYTSITIKTFDLAEDIRIVVDADSTVGGSNVDFFITYKYVLP